MAFTLVQHNLVSATTGTSWTGTWPQATVSGNLGVAVLALHATAITVSNSGGWTQAVTFTHSTQCEIWYKANIAASEANPVFSFGASSVTGHLGLLEFSGVDTTSPLDRTGTGTGSAVATMTVSTSATITANSELVVALAGDAEGNTSGITWAASSSSPAGVADINNIAPPKQSEGSADAWNTSGASGTTPSITFNLSSSSNTALAGVMATFFAAGAAAAQIWQPPRMNINQAVQRASVY